MGTLGVALLRDSPAPAACVWAWCVAGPGFLGTVSFSVSWKRYLRRPQFSVAVAAAASCRPSAHSSSVVPRGVRAPSPLAFLTLRVFTSESAGKLCYRAPVRGLYRFAYQGLASFSMLPSCRGGELPSWPAGWGADLTMEPHPAKLALHPNVRLAWLRGERLGSVWGDVQRPERV